MGKGKESEYNISKVTEQAQETIEKFNQLCEEGLNGESEIYTPDALMCKIADGETLMKYNKRYGRIEVARGEQTFSLQPVDEIKSDDEFPFKAIKNLGGKNTLEIDVAEGGRVHIGSSTKE